MLRRIAAFVVGVLLLASLAAAVHAADAVIFPARAEQGAMVIGKVPPGSQVRYAGRTLHVTPYGSVVFGVARDASGAAVLDVTPPGGGHEQVWVAIAPRDWPTEHVNGVPPRTVSPPAAVAARIAREQKAVSDARATSFDGTGFAERFIWPVKGRISGRFGRHRVYNGTPGAAHSGMDIAVPQGTPVKAPASGRVVLAEPDLYFTGGTILIDHGYGIGSNFLHLSTLDVAVGDQVRQGDVVGRVGATGRATGPHLHWGLTWFDTRRDPLLVLER